MTENNPYAPPATWEEAPLRLEAETIRREHLQREACAKGLGLVFLGIGFALLGFVAFLSPKLLSTGSSTKAAYLIYGLSVLAFAALAFLMALRLRRLDRRTRLWLGVIAVAVVWIVPIGTSAAAWIFYQFLSRKGAVIFSEEYRAAVAATRGISARPSWVNLMILAAILAVSATCIFMLAEQAL